MTDIKLIKGAKPAVNESAVKVLDDMIGRVKSGEVAGVLVIGVTHDDCVIDGWSGGNYNKYTMVGALSKITQDYMTEEIESR